MSARLTHVPVGLLAAFAAALLLSGCATGALPPEVPGMREPAAPLAQRHGAHRGIKSLAIPDGPECLAQLSNQGVSFHVLESRPGVATPVSITSPIAGIRYASQGKTSLVCDCRLAVALGWLGPELRAFGIHEVDHSGAYVYRTTHSGRPSLHAQGLAIDVHALKVDRRTFWVSRDFERGGGDNCSPDSRMINRLSCELSRTGLFEEVITPDDDSDHRDHVHLALAPL
jgi:hypothetical protein